MKFIYLLGLLSIFSGCAVIGDIQTDLLGLEAQPVDICEKENQQCYMEDGENLGICNASHIQSITEDLVCNNCRECIGCSTITLGDQCKEFMCEVNEREIQANPGDKRRFASLAFNRVLDQETCDKLKGL